MSYKLPHLQRLLQYQNHHVTMRYCTDFKRSKNVSNKCLVELLKFLWLNQKAKLTNADVYIAMYPEMSKIDDMWHEFLLFTHDYQEFSYEYFGGFIHHQPTDASEKHTRKRFKKEFSKFLNYTYDNLGEDTVKFWFKDLL